MDQNVLDAAKSAFAAGPAITLGAVVHNGECHPEPTVRIALEMMNRHGLIAGATGTGKKFGAACVTFCVVTANFPL